MSDESTLKNNKDARDLQEPARVTEPPVVIGPDGKPRTPKPIKVDSANVDEDIRL